jgi:hypothetical protein
MYLEAAGAIAELVKPSDLDRDHIILLFWRASRHCRRWCSATSRPTRRYRPQLMAKENRRLEPPVVWTLNGDHCRSEFELSTV